MLAASERPHGRTPWVWLWELELERRTKVLPAVVFRFNSSDDEITWPPGAGAPDTFYPFPCDWSEIEESNEGDLPGIDLIVDNTSRTLARFIHAANGFQGNAATLILTHADALAAPAYPNHEFFRFDFVVSDAVVTAETVTLRLEQASFFEVRVPTDRYVAGRCRWRFGSIECGYPITAVAAYTTCNKTLADCIARGEDEVFRRIPKLHPKRFGGFPGIPQQRVTR